jgi:CheY-like chemotaxis protein
MPGRILIVDDSESFRAAAAQLLAARGLEPLGPAGDGDAALAAVAAGCPDGILLDINLPDRDGFAVAALLASVCPAAAIVLTSSDIDVIGVAGRHLDVGDHDIRAVHARLADQVARVGGGSRDLESGVLQHADDPLAHDGLVLADEHPDRCGLSHAPKLTRLASAGQRSPAPAGSKPAGSGFPHSRCGDRARQVPAEPDWPASRARPGWRA